MARKVFFSFHHKGDIGRIGQVRNSWLTLGSDLGFVDAAEWESIQRQGDESIKRWINNQLDGTSVTVVLIGKETSERPWVKYEIIESHKKGNGLLGIYIDGIKDFRTQQYGERGQNPFSKIQYTNSYKTLADTYPVYEWVSQEGHKNIGRWIEEAAKRAGR